SLHQSCPAIRQPAPFALIAPSDRGLVDRLGRFGSGLIVTEPRQERLRISGPPHPERSAGREAFAAGRWWRFVGGYGMFPRQEAAVDATRDRPAGGCLGGGGRAAVAGVFGLVVGCDASWCWSCGRDFGGAS